MKRNLEIREQAKANGVCLWEIANALGIQESFFSKKLRQELPEQEKQQILSIIRVLAKEKEGVSCLKC